MAPTDAPWLNKRPSPNRKGAGRGRGCMLVLVRFCQTVSSDLTEPARSYSPNPRGHVRPERRTAFSGRRGGCRV